jgi:hypothetical protein
MSNFIRVDSQEVKHKSGYSIYSAGRFFLGYKDKDTSYKVYCEHLLLGNEKKDALCIHTSTLYSDDGNEVYLSKETKNKIMDRVISGAKLLTKFIIITTDESGNEKIL